MRPENPEEDQERLRDRRTVRRRRTDSTPVIGTPIGPDDVALLQRFRERFLPDTRIAGYDTLAKWLFGLTATVAALGAGLSNTAFSKLTGPGIVAYGIAVLLSGAGLGVATFALSIDLPDANWQSLDNMFKEMKRPLDTKKLMIRIASILLALALVTAATAPLISHFWDGAIPQSLGLTYSLASGSVEAALAKDSLKPGTPISLRIFSTDRSMKEVLLAATSAIVTSNARMEIHIPKSTVPTDAASLRILAEFDEVSGPKKEATEIKIRQISQPPKSGP